MTAFNKVKKLFSMSGNEIKLHLKDIVFTHADENITRSIRLIKKTIAHIPGNSVIIDIGAFDGTTSLNFSKAFPLCKIYAFEPNPEAYKTATNNCSNNNNIKLFNCAISDKEGTAVLNVTSNNVSSSLNSINEANADKTQPSSFTVKTASSVETRTLDSLNLQNILLLEN